MIYFRLSIATCMCNKKCIIKERCKDIFVVGINVLETELVLADIVVGIRMLVLITVPVKPQ